MLATVGTDLTSGVERFTFGRMDLIDGISFLLLAMATFALSEAILMTIRRTGPAPVNMSAGQLKLSFKEIRAIVPPISRSSLLGFFVGVLPGAGATIASFLAYGVERNLKPITEKPEFGKGNIKGLAAPETANNAACTGSFVPLLTLGIPGSGTTAVLLGALIAYGIQPGPRLFVDEPEIFWAVIVSMYFGNVILLVLNLPLIPWIARLLTVPREYLIPIIAFFSIMGVYLVSFNTFDIYLVVTIALLAVVLRLFDYPMAPLLLGFILGDMLEDNLRRAITIGGGELSVLWERPTTVVLFALAALALCSPILSSLRQRLAATHE